jgi:acyl-CoA reductase-like NAD-dependent aldehyde dehydrogenase
MALLPLAALAEEPLRGSDAAVRAIIQRSLDEALQAQVQHLFAIWMRDDRGQPQRASAGIRRAVAAYRHAIKAIETERLSWNNVRKVGGPDSLQGPPKFREER